MNNINRFYSIIEKKQSNYKNLFEFLRTFISSEKEVSYTGKRIYTDKKHGRLPPVNTMIRLASLFDNTFFDTTEEERLRKLKRKLKREMHLEKSWGI